MVFDASLSRLKLLARFTNASTHRGEGGRKWEERKEEEITIERFRLSFHPRIHRGLGSGCESLAEIFTTNFAQQFEPDGPWSGRSINDQAPKAERDCHVNTWLFQSSFPRTVTLNTHLVPDNRYQSAHEQQIQLISSISKSLFCWHLHLSTFNLCKNIRVLRIRFITVYEG